MKKTKLLTSIAALALILGLGACETSQNNEEDITTDQTTSETIDEEIESDSSGSTTSGESSLDDDEYKIISEIFKTVSEVNTLALLWPGYHAQINESNTSSTDEVYFSEDDDNGLAYGYWYSKDSEGKVSESFYKEGAIYKHSIEEYDTKENYTLGETYTDSFDSLTSQYEMFKFSEMFTLVDNILEGSDTLDNYDISITYENDNTWPVVSLKKTDTKDGQVVNYEYVYVASSSYKLRRLEYKETGLGAKEYVVTRTTYEDVRAVTERYLNTGLWEDLAWKETPDTPQELIRKACYTSSWTIEMEFIEITSEKYSDWETLFTDLFGDGIPFSTTHYIVDITYTKDGVLFQYYKVDDTQDNPEKEIYDVDLRVNDYEQWLTGNYYVNFWNEPGDLTLDDEYSSSFGGHLWPDDIWCLYNSLDIIDDIFVQDGEEYVENDHPEYGTMIDYTLTDSLTLNQLKTLLATFFDCSSSLTSSWMYIGSATVKSLNRIYDLFESYGTIDFSSTFYKDLGEYDLMATTGDLIVESYNSSTGVTSYYLEIDTMYSSVFNVGKTTLPDEYLKYIPS